MTEEKLFRVDQRETLSYLMTTDTLKLDNQSKKSSRMQNRSQYNFLGNLWCSDHPQFISPLNLKIVLSWCIIFGPKSRIRLSQVPFIFTSPLVQGVFHFFVFCVSLTQFRIFTIFWTYVSIVNQIIDYPQSQVIATTYKQVLQTHATICFTNCCFVYFIHYRLALL